MTEQYVVAGLIRKRASLAGEIEQTHERLHQTVQELEHLDATLRMFDPDYPLETIKPKELRPPPDWAKRDALSRAVLGMLRQATEPMTTRDVALELLVSRALDQSDKRLLRLMSKRVGVALRIQRDRGVLRSEQGPGQYLLWKVAHQRKN
ncbi:MAG: hypothetical protein QF893_03700 [Alphaproteobacteria bacterium]|jgi:hypothetical protein|nr:hypothetical protein [Alphaproteobacteria bacterium]